jgi:hypothetical protein
MDVPTLCLALTIMLLHPQIYFGIRYRTWLYLFLMTSAMVLHIAAYVARVQQSFLMEGVAMVVAPAFLSVAVHCSFLQLAGACGWDEVKTYGRRLIVLDSMVLAIQLVGGLLACGRYVTTAVSVFRGGLAWWLPSTLVTIGLAGKIAWTGNTRERNLDGKRDDLKESKTSGWFLGGESLVLQLKESANICSSRACERLHPCKNALLLSGDGPSNLWGPI